MVIFHKGSGRTVLAVPRLGLVFKIARIRWGDAWAEVRRAKSKHHQYRLGKKYGEPFGTFLRRQIFEFTVEESPSLKQALFLGIVDNWRERSYYKASNPLHRLLLQPTYISFFGFLNVQKYGKPMKSRSLLDPKFGELQQCYFEVVGAPLKEDGHHFTYEENFHHEGHAVRFLDYASLKTRRIISEYGLEILRRFVPPDPSAY